MPRHWLLSRLSTPSDASKYTVPGTTAGMPVYLFGDITMYRDDGFRSFPTCP